MPQTSQTIDSPIQSASDDTVKSFLALGDDQKRDTLGKLSDPAKQALLAGIKGYKPAPATDARGLTAAAYPHAGSAQENPGGVPLTTGPAMPALPTVLPKSAHDIVTPKNMYLAGKGQLPYLAGGAATALAGPEAGIPLEMLLAAVGGGAGRVAEHEAGRAVGAEDPWQTAGQAAWDVGSKSAEIGALTGGAGLAKKALLAAMPKLQNAVEGIFRAVPSDNPNYRDNVVAAMGDLQDMVRTGAIPKRSKGGLVNPEMYFRQVNSAIDQRLQDMFKNEYMGQINAVARRGAQVDIAENPAVIQQTMKYIARTQPADSSVRATALRLADNPTMQVPIKDAADLARTINAHLREIEAARPETAYVSAQRSAVKASMDRLDKALSSGINGKLEQYGQPGIAGYERRYAALSSINKELDTQMNSLERQRLELKPHAGVSAKGRGWLSTAGNLFKKNAGADLEDALTELGGSPTIQRPVAGPQPMSGPRALIGTGPLTPPLPEHSVFAPPEPSSSVRGKYPPLADNRLLMPGSATADTPRSVSGPGFHPLETGPEPTRYSIPPMPDGPKMIGPGTPQPQPSPFAYRKIGPVSIDGPQVIEGEPQSFGEQTPGSHARVVGTGKARRMEIWNQQQKKWVKVDWPMSAKP